MLQNPDIAQDGQWNLRCRKRGKHGDNILHVLARNGDLGMIQYIHKIFGKKAVKFPGKGENEQTLCHIAASRGDIVMMDWLLKTFDKKEWNLQRNCDSRHQTVINLAAKGDHLDLLKFLHKKHSDKVDFRYVEYGVKNAPEIASYNGNLDMVQWFLETFPDQYDLANPKCSEFILEPAAYRGHLDIVQFVNEKYGHLVDFGAKFTRSYKKETIFNVAASAGKLHVLSWLVDTFPAMDVVKIRSGLKETVAQSAAKKGHVRVLEYLLKKYPENVKDILGPDKLNLGRNLAFKAAQQLRVLKFLHKNYAKVVDFWAKDKNGVTMYDYANFKTRPWLEETFPGIEQTLVNSDQTTLMVYIQ